MLNSEILGQGFGDSFHPNESIVEACVVDTSTISNNFTFSTERNYTNGEGWGYGVWLPFWGIDNLEGYYHLSLQELYQTGFAFEGNGTGFPLRQEDDSKIPYPWFFTYFLGPGR